MTSARRQRPQAAMRVPRQPLRLGRWLLVLAGVMSALLGWYGTVRLRDPQAFPIRRVTVDGDFRYLAPRHIETLVTQAVHGGFFQVDVQDIRRRILKEPWVREANVQRRWPDAIRVSIVEQQPVAAWGPKALLNDRAEVFAPDPSSFPAGLVHLHGPQGSEREVWIAYGRTARMLQPVGLTVTELVLSDRRAWRVGLSDGSTLVLGRHRVEERLARFLKAWPTALQARWPQVATVDLRYTNGFAVRERGAQPATPAPRK